MNKGIVVYILSGFLNDSPRLFAQLDDNALPTLDA